MFSRTQNTRRAKTKPRARTPVGQFNTRVSTIANEQSKRHKVNLPPVSLHQGENFRIESVGAVPKKVREHLEARENSSEIPLGRISSKWAYVCLDNVLYVWDIYGNSQSVILRVPENVRDSLGEFIIVEKDDGFAGEGESMCVIMVARCGAVHLWSGSIINSLESPVSLSLPLEEGQQISRISSVGSESIFFLTNDSTLWRVKRIGSSMKARMVKQPVSIFSGISQSVSRMFQFSQEVQEEKSLKSLVVGMTPGEHFFDVFILNSRVLQRWSIPESSSGTDSIKWEYPIQNTIEDHLCNTVYSQSLRSSLKCWILQLQSITCNSLVVLAASTNSQEDVIRYSVMEFSYNLGESSSETGPRMIRDLVLPFKPSSKLDLDKLLDVRLTTNSISRRDIMLETSTTMYISWLRFNPIKLCAIQFSKNYSTAPTLSLELAKVDSSSIFGLGMADSKPSLLYLTSELKNGLCSVTMSFGDNEPTLESIPAVSISRANEDAELYMAIRNHSKKDSTTISEFVDILQRRYGVSSGTSTGFSEDATSQHAEDLIVAIGKRILDAKPSTGLRWTESMDLDSHSVTPQLVRCQLEEKLKQFMDFVSFIKGFPNIVKCLSSAGWCLVEYGEKIKATLALCHLQNQCQGNEKSSHRISGKLLIQAIKRTASDRGYASEQLHNEGLNMSDMFYSEVTCVDQFLYNLQLELQEFMRANNERSDSIISANAISECNVAIHSILDAALESRKKDTSIFGLDTALGIPPLPWTCSSNIRTLLKFQINLTASVLGYQRGMSSVNISLPPTDSKELSRQIVALGYLLLGSFEEEASFYSDRDSTLWKESFEEAKEVVINPLVAMGSSMQRDALDMSEKYKYFPGLVELCLRESSHKTSHANFLRKDTDVGLEWLDHYSNRFSRDGFVEFLFRWYAGEIPTPWKENDIKSEQDIALLLSQQKKNHEQLHSFLQKHSFLSKYCWVHELHTGQYDKASRHLANEAIHEMDALNLRKTLLSIGKLVSIAHSSSTDESSDDSINKTIGNELTLVRIQEILRTIPEFSDISKPLNPSDLVTLCLEAMKKCKKSEMNSRVQRLLLGLEVLEIMKDSCYSSEDLMRLYRETWRIAIQQDENLWIRLCEEYMLNGNDNELVALLKDSLLYNVLSNYFSGIKRGIFGGCATLTIEIIDQLVSESEENNSLWNMKYRQLYVKALKLVEGVA